LGQNPGRTWVNSRARRLQHGLVERLALPFPILSDAEGHFGGALRLPSFSTGGETYLQRLTLAVKDGRIESVFYSVSKPADHAVEVLSRLSQKP
jgi:peroxiredoxin